jgi:hypothetical protein
MLGYAVAGVALYNMGIQPAENIPISIDKIL